MKIVADSEIPHVKHFFESSGELILKPGREIKRQDLVDADILLVRSVTSVNHCLLQATNVKFVGSATSGVDHMDTAWLDEAGIEWSVATGCNAKAVSQHVVALIASLQKQGFLTGKNCRAGVIGVGSIGRLVVENLKILGFEVKCRDPFRKMHDELTELDLMTLHVPLTTEGQHPTLHLIEKNFLQQQKQNTVLINAARGAVINSLDLKHHGQHLLWCLDVWENEPTIDFEILDQTFIATPHIAGYSLQSKYRGIEMIYQVLVDKKIWQGKLIQPLKYPVKTLSFNNQKCDWRDIILAIHDPFVISKNMKQSLLENANAFDPLRKKLMDRYEFDSVHVTDVNLEHEDREILKKLNIQILS